MITENPVHSGFDTAPAPALLKNFKIKTYTTQEITEPSGSGFLISESLGRSGFDTAPAPALLKDF